MITYGSLCRWMALRTAKFLRWWLDAGAQYWRMEAQDAVFWSEDAAPCRARMVDYIDGWASVQVLIMILSRKENKT